MDKAFKIGVFGLKPNEQNTLSSIFKLAASRNNKYAIVSATERETADIILVDADDASAMSEWKSFSVHQKKPVIKVTKKVPATVNEGEVYLRRPLILKRVLDTLEPVASGLYILIDENTFIDIPSPSPEEPNDSGVKVLVVDDALAIRKAMDINLRRFGVNIDLAETGEEALEYTEKNIYDIIFLDVMLPGIDGYQVCKKIKSHKTAKSTPVVMLTGKDGGIDKLRGKMAGANLWLTKPVEPDELKKVLEQYLPGIVGG
ncbi:Response regulator consisting of a CheY-like receiver [Beggiatoa sp. PS]|nr:Response regulator consisting of a CheY-like receiver [Beggiatoa sp. PS]